MLYDLGTDPKEVVDLGDSKKHQKQIERMREMMFVWARQQHTRRLKQAGVTMMPKTVFIWASGKKLN